MAALALGGRPADAVDLVVVAESRIDLEARTLGREVQAVGTLRDDLGAPIGRQPVIVRFEGAGGAVVVVEALTGSDGAFEADASHAPGPVRVTASYAGTAWVDATSSGAAAQVESRTISVTAPQLRTATARATSGPLAVYVAAGDEGVDGVLVYAAGPCLATPSEARTLEGSALLPLRLEASAAGACHVTVTAVGEGRFEDARAEVTIRRVGPAQAEVQVTQGRLPRSWHVAVSLVDAAGPVEGARLAVGDGSGVATEGATAADGRARLTTEADRHATLLVALAGDLDGAALDEARVALAAMASPRRTLERMAFLALAGLVAGTLAWAGLSRRRSDPAGGEISAARRPGVEVAPAVVVAEEEEEAGALHGLVVDAETRTVVEGASVSCGGVLATTDAEGRFRVSIAPQGPGAEVAVRAEGYMPLQGPMPAGARGLTIALRSVGAEVRDLLLASEEPGAARWWGRETISSFVGRVRTQRRGLRRPVEPERTSTEELAAALRRAADTPADEVAATEALALLADVVYFGGRGATPETLSLARRLSEQARRGRT